MIEYEYKHKGLGFNVERDWSVSTYPYGKITYKITIEGRLIQYGIYAFTEQQAIVKVKSNIENSFNPKAFKANYEDMQ